MMDYVISMWSRHLTTNLTVQKDAMNHLPVDQLVTMKIKYNDDCTCLYCITYQETGTSSYYDYLANR